MKTYDKAAMIAEFLAEMNAVEDTPKEVAVPETQFVSDLSQQLSDDLARDIASITVRIATAAHGTGDIHVLDKGLMCLMKACVGIVRGCSETDEEYKAMLDDLGTMMYQLADERKL